MVVRDGKRRELGARDRAVRHRVDGAGTEAVGRCRKLEARHELRAAVDAHREKIRTVERKVERNRRRSVAEQRSEPTGAEDDALVLLDPDRRSPGRPRVEREREIVLAVRERGAVRIGEVPLVQHGGRDACFVGREGGRRGEGDRRRDEKRRDRDNRWNERVRSHEYCLLSNYRRSVILRVRLCLSARSTQK